jgi:hypothetical protein
VGQGPEYNLRTSASLKAKQGHGAQEWLISMAESAILLNSLMRVIHPQLFQMGMEGMKAMEGQECLLEALEMWYSIFNGVQVISNRETPIHRDHSSRWEWYDLLTTIGPYSSTFFEFPGVGIKLAYNSGTVIGLCGRVLRHGVTMSDGERICVAYYMKENVQKRLETTFATWSHWNFYVNSV